MARLTDAQVKAIAAPATGRDEYPDDLVTGLRLRIGTSGRKVWIVRTRAGGKLLNKTLGTFPVLSLAEARDCARDLLRDIAKHGAPRTSRTFGELADLWLDKVAKPTNRGWEAQQRQLNRHVLPHWGTRNLDTIRRGDVRDLIDGIEGAILPNRVLALVRTIFRYALSRDWLDASPAEAIAKPKHESPRDRFLSMEEVARVYSTAPLLGYPMGGFLQMMFLTAQRRSEVAGMRWDQVDMDAGTWLLTGDEVKSARQHLVPLSPQAVALLKSTPRLGEYVWTTDGTTHVKGFGKAKTRLDDFLGAAGDALKPWRLHDIRRTVATHMVRLGVTETIVGRVLNHAAQGVTARVYALHSYEPEKRSALTRWAAEIDRAIAGKDAGNVVKING